MKRRIGVEFICFLFITLFIYTAVSKLSDFPKFHAEIGQSPMLTAFAGPIAILVPTVELLVSILLMWPRFRLLSLYVSLSMMTVFTAYIIIILNFSPFVPCSCGGVLEVLSWEQHLIFNAGFMLLAVVGIHLQSSAGETNYTRSDFKGTQ